MNQQAENESRRDCHHHETGEYIPDKIIGLLSGLNLTVDQAIHVLERSIIEVPRIARLGTETEEKEATAGTVATSEESGVVYVKSPISVKEAVKSKECFSTIITEVISLIGSKGVTFETALYILDKSQESLYKCTLLQTEYTP